MCVLAAWSDYYSGQRVNSFARFVALRHHDARVDGSIPGLGSFNTVTFVTVTKSLLVFAILQCIIDQFNNIITS